MFLSAFFIHQLSLAGQDERHTLNQASGCNLLRSNPS